MPSESEASRRWFNDIHHHIAMTEGFVAGMTYATFKDDDLYLYAVTRCLEIISEASRHLPEELKGRHPSIDTKVLQSLTHRHGRARHGHPRLRAASVRHEGVDGRNKGSGSV